MSYVNCVILVGHLGTDPKTKTTKNGKAMTTFRLATSRRYRDSNGESVEDTQWHHIQLFGRQAEIAGEYLAKGHQVCLRGSIRSNRYTDKNGIEKVHTSVVVHELSLVDNRHRNLNRAA